MTGVLLSAGELQVLHECSGLAFKVYMRLRSRMDFSTGVVGLRSGMSITALREWGEELIERGGGMQRVKPSVQQVRTALAQLERRGLLRRKPGETLVFLMPLALTKQARPNQTQQEPNTRTQHGTQHEPNTPKGSNGAWSDATEGANPTRNIVIPDGQNGPNSTHIGVYVNRKPLGGGVHDWEDVDAATQQNAAAAVNGLAKSMTRAAPGEGCSAQMRSAIGLVAQLRQIGVRCNAQDPRLLAWVHERIDPAVLVRAVEVGKARRGGSGQAMNIGLIDVIARDLIAQDVRQAEPTPAWWGSEKATFDKARALGLRPIRMETVSQLRQRIRDALSERRRA